MHKFFKATIIVTIFSVATRALGFFLRVYLSRVMGAETLGAYQISMSVFGVLLTIISSGIPLIVSRNVAYFEAQKDTGSQSRTITAGLIVGVAISIIICGVFYFLAVPLEKIISTESVQIILILLPALVASSVYAILRGGLWGRKYFFSISFTEFFEQLVRIVLLVVLFNIPLGLTSGQTSALSLTLSTVASCLLVVVLYFVFKGKLSCPKGELKTVIKTSTPVTLVKTVSSAIGSVIAMILPFRLMMFGYSHSEALAEYGIFMGMTMPILMIPATFISSISVALVPELSAYTNNIDKMVTNLDGLSKKVTNAIKITIAISFVLIASFVCFGRQIGQLLFNNSKAGIYIAVCAIMMVPMGISQICSSILNAIGLEKKALINYSIGAVALLVLILVLPQFIGTYAIAVSMTIMHIIISIISLWMLKKRKLINLSFIKTIAVCALVCVPSATLAHFVYLLISRFANMLVSTMFGGAVGVISTILLMLVFDVAKVKVFVFRINKKRARA